MAAPAIAALPSTPSRAAPAWVIGRGADLAWLIGGAVLSYALLAAHLVFAVPAVALYVVWVLAIDGPHVFATLSRTYLDAEERAARARLLRWSLGFYALGPAAVGAAVLLGTRVPFDVFLVFCGLWAYWHVVRQHYGVLVLYKRKAGEPAGDRFDERVLHVGLVAPFVSFTLTHPRTVAMMGFDAPPAWARAGSLAAWAVLAVAAVAFVAHEAAEARDGRPVNVPKVLFLAAAISVSVLLFAPPVVARVQYEAVSPIVTSFHNVQYLAIVWFFHRNRRARRRMAGPRVAGSLAAFLVAGVAFTLVYRVGFGCVFSAWPGCDVGTQLMPLPGGLTVADLGVGFLWGFALHHYYLDQRIWHVRHDAGVGRALQLDRR